MDIEADAIVDEAAEEQRRILEAAPVALRPHADGEARHFPDLDHRGVEVAEQDADRALVAPIRLARAQHRQASEDLVRVARGAAIADGQRDLRGGPSIEDAPAHHEPRRCPRQHQRQGGAEDALPQQQRLASGGGGVHRRLQRRPVIGDAVAGGAEVPHRQPLSHLVLDRARHSAGEGGGEQHGVAREDGGIAVRIEAEQPVRARGAQRQHHAPAHLAGILAERRADLLALFLLHGHQAVQLVVQRARAQQAVVLEVRGALHRHAASQRHRLTGCGGDGKARHAACAVARTGHGIAAGQHDAAEPQLEVVGVEDREGEGEVGARAVTDILHARRDIADADVLGHRLSAPKRSGVGEKGDG